MLLGSMAFLYPINLKAQWARSFYVVGIACILLAYCFIAPTMVWPGYLALLPALGAYLVIIAKQNNHGFHHNRLMQIIGRTSYSTYLWHWPFAALLYSLGKHQQLEYALTGIVLSFIVGFIAYVLIEQKLAKITKKQLNYVALILFVSIFGIDKYIISERGFSDRLPQGFVDAISASPIISETLCENRRPRGVPHLKTPFCQMGDETNPQPILLFGDSFAGHWQGFWQELAKENHFSFDSLTLSSCWAALDDTYMHESKRGRYYQQCLIHREYIKEHAQHYKTIIVGSMWGGMNKKGYFDSAMEFVKTLAAQQIQVIIMPSPIHYDQNVLKKYSTAIFNGLTDFDLSQEPKVDDVFAIEANQRLAELAKNSRYVHFIPRNLLFSQSDSYQKNGYKIPYSLDGSHLSTEGAIHALSLFEQSNMYQEIVDVLIAP